MANVKLIAFELRLGPGRCIVLVPSKLGHFDPGIGIHAVECRCNSFASEPRHRVSCRMKQIVCVTEKDADHFCNRIDVTFAARFCRRLKEVLGCFGVILHDNVPINPAIGVSPCRGFAYQPIIPDTVDHYDSFGERVTTEIRQSLKLFHSQPAEPVMLPTLRL